MSDGGADDASGAPLADGRAWLAVAVALVLGSALAWWLPAPWLDWQPGRGLAEPWRLVSAAFVHWSERHWLANAGAAIVVAALGAVARLPHRAAWAWLAAWPLTHALLWVQPGLLHYGGLSGVLHAAVAVAGLFLAAGGPRRRERWIGAAILAGLALKIVLERPWAGPPARPGDWDIAVAPVAHAAGALAGLACAALARPWRDRQCAR